MCCHGRCKLTLERIKKGRRLPPDKRDIWTSSCLEESPFGEPSFLAVLLTWLCVTIGDPPKKRNTLAGFPLASFKAAPERVPSKSHTPISRRVSNARNEALISHIAAPGAEGCVLGSMSVLRAPFLGCSEGKQNGKQQNVGLHTRYFGHRMCSYTSECLLLLLFHSQWTLQHKVLALRCFTCLALSASAYGYVAK